MGPRAPSPAPAGEAQEREEQLLVVMIRNWVLDSTAGEAARSQ